MKIEQIAMLGVMFLIVFGAALKAMTLLRPDPVQRRIEELAQPGVASEADAGAEKNWVETVTKVSERVARLDRKSVV